MNEINVEANVGKEIAEISQDFANPMEVLREALHNAYDAGAKKVSMKAMPEKLKDGRRVLTIEIKDDGLGMDEMKLKHFFGLGYSEKPPIADRTIIGFKGHGTKIFYQAKDLFVVSRQKEGKLCLAYLKEAREVVSSKQLPIPKLLVDKEAEEFAQKEKLTLPGTSGTTIRLVDYTPDSSSLIDKFRTDVLENYIRWFTIFGSFKSIVDPNNSDPPMELSLQGIDRSDFRLVQFGHPLPAENKVDIRELKKQDERRPFNYFWKTLIYPDYAIEGGYKIDIAAVFEGKRGRLERDKNIARQGSKGLYAEEERYGLWLCRDFIPIENKSSWLLDETCPIPLENIRRPLIFVNSQDFMLIANRGSVGNSSQQLMDAVKNAIYEILRDKISVDSDIDNFLNGYQEDLFSRQREKDKKALQRRIDRYNKKAFYEITLPNKNTHQFFEPKREITLFGLIAELNLFDHKILSLEILDYDDHSGIDLLVRRDGESPSNLLDKNKVAYVELKYELSSQINHAFDHLYAIVCWELGIQADDIVTDATGSKFRLEQSSSGSVTYSHLVPPPDNRVSHNIKVIVLKRFLKERYKLVEKDHPNPIPSGKRT